MEEILITQLGAENVNITKGTIVTNTEDGDIETTTNDTIVIMKSITMAIGIGIADIRWLRNPTAPSSGGGTERNYRGCSD